MRFPICPATGKKRYRTAVEAQRHVARVRAERPRTELEPALRAYPCPGCEGWHVGHPDADRSAGTSAARTWTRDADAEGGAP